jgi:uncharacterized RDD family membrane protein YckC
MKLVNEAVNHALEIVDVDGVVRRINVNNVVERIDVNDVVSRIDWNQVLSSIDWDLQIRRIDLDAVVKQIDTKAIIARSSTGMLSNFLDSLRTTVVLLDLYLWVVSRCKLWTRRHRERCYLPPKPGRHGYRQRNDRTIYPKGRVNKAVAVQGRHCGFVSKAIAVMIDVFTITFLFGVLFQIIEWSLILFLNDTHEEATEKTSDFKQHQTYWMIFLYCAYWFAYFFLTVALTGQTFGMLLVGLRVVNCQKSSPYNTVSVSQALLRSCLLPLTLSICWPLGVIGLYRRDGRMLHDLVASTGMIYLWDAKMAKERRDILREDNGSSVGQDDDSDALDAYIDATTQANGDEEQGFLGHEVVLGQQDTDVVASEYSTF